ncbi:MAG: SDR family NAD(P)-dependent oxidoreductase, partial [Firmicutes bacterium]|nr:SDR family NAD(P)-dependent oxidoreductase [Bacillota bacterium]
MKKKFRWTLANMPDQTGKVAIVTGANTGLGFETALHLASKGASIVLAVRSLERGQKAIDRILSKIPTAALSLVKLDLGSLESVKSAAKEILEKHQQIDILINNAGLITSKGVTQDGFELLLGVNYLGHFALTNLLLDRITATANSRIINVSSVIHRKSKRKWLEMDFNDTSLRSMQAYSRSKLCNLLFTYALQRRLLGTTTISVAAHPGIAFSEVIRD